jgi:hypothetical protein
LTLAELVLRPGYKEISELVQLFQNLSDAECASDTRDLALSLAYSRLRSALDDREQSEEIITRLQGIEFNPVIDEVIDERGHVVHRFVESDELGDEADRVLSWRFRRKVRKVLLEALSHCRPSDERQTVLAPPPKLGCSFVTDKQVYGLLLERWNEAWQCANLGLLLPASVVLGSVLEGALTYYFEFVADDTARNRHDLKGSPDFWKLKSLVEAVVSEVDFRTGVPELTNQIREERNYIHPNVGLKSAPLTLEGLHTNFAIISELFARLSSHAAQVKP